MGQRATVAVRLLAAEPIVYRLPAASALLVDLELGRPPLHITIVGRKDDPGAQSLFQAALRYPAGYSASNGGTRAKANSPIPTCSIPS